MTDSRWKTDEEYQDALLEDIEETWPQLAEQLPRYLEIGQKIHDADVPDLTPLRDIAKAGLITSEELAYYNKVGWILHINSWCHSKLLEMQVKKLSDQFQVIISVNETFFVHCTKCEKNFNPNFSGWPEMVPIFQEAEMWCNMHILFAETECKA